MKLHVKQQRQRRNLGDDNNTPNVKQILREHCKILPWEGRGQNEEETSADEKRISRQIQ